MTPQPNRPRGGWTLVYIALGVIVALAVCAFVYVVNYVIGFSRSGTGSFIVNVDREATTCESALVDGYVKLTGYVENQGERTSQVVEVKMFVTDKAGRSVGKDSMYIDEAIDPGARRAWEGYVEVGDAAWDGCRATVGTVR